MLPKIGWFEFWRESNNQPMLRHQKGVFQVHLIIHNKLGIFVEDGVLSSRQWTEWFQHPAGVHLCWGAVL